MAGLGALLGGYGSDEDDEMEEPQQGEHWHAWLWQRCCIFKAEQLCWL
jgi:hypothetical protein